MVLVLPSRAYALVGMRWKPIRKIHKLYRIEHENIQRKEVSIMSRTIVIGIDFGNVYSLSSGSFGIGKSIGRIARYIVLELHRIEIRSSRRPCFIDSVSVLDVMRKKNWPSSIECIGKEIVESIKHERFSRRYMPNNAGGDKAVLSYLPADIRISGSLKKSNNSSEVDCPEKGIQTFGLDATEKQSNELPQLSISMAVHLWRSKRHRRRRICDLWNAPWKLNNDWNSAPGESVFQCA